MTSARAQPRRPADTRSWRGPRLVLPLLFLLASCSGTLPTATVAPARSGALAPSDGASVTVSGTVVQQTVTRTALLPADPTATGTPLPTSWQDWPVIPTVSDAARAIYERGLRQGNSPDAFSKVGDCEATPAWFLGDFDQGTAHYDLGPYLSLEGVIAHFTGSFQRTSLASRQGFSASSVLSPVWADPSQCEAGETPLACEVRLHRPSVAFVMLGTNDRWRLSLFEEQMRAILDYLIAEGIVPILSTKADNLEGDGSINATIVRLAQEYDVPLWNFWLAVQPLPDHGLQPDGAHITWGPNQFDDPHSLERGWPVRNLTALQALDAVWRALTAPWSPEE